MSALIANCTLSPLGLINTNLAGEKQCGQHWAWCGKILNALLPILWFLIEGSRTPQRILFVTLYAYFWSALKSLTISSGITSSSGPSFTGSKLSAYSKSFAFLINFPRGPVKVSPLVAFPSRISTETKVQDKLYNFKLCP